jgi:hypothetical protein
MFIVINITVTSLFKRHKHSQFVFGQRESAIHLLVAPAEGGHRIADNDALGIANGNVEGNVVVAFVQVEVDAVA